MRPRTRTRILVLLVGTIVCLGAAELAVRVFRPPLYLQPPPETVWDPWRGRAHRASATPGLDYELVPSVSIVQGGIAVDTNAAGLRGPEISSKSAGVVRIAAIGDSLTFGLSVDESLTWPRTLERDLRAARPDLAVEVQNFGVCGYSIRDEVVAFEAKCLPLEPDLVIFGYCVNDPELAPTNGLQRHYSKTRLWHHSALLRLAAATIRARRIAAAGDLIHWLHAEGGEPWTVALAAMDRVQGLCAARGIPVVFAVFPMFSDLEHWADYPWNDVHERVLESARARGFGALDLFPAFAGRGDPPTALAIDAWHPTAEGYGLAAQAISAHLLEDPQRWLVSRP